MDRPLILDRHPRIDLLHKEKPKDWMVSNEKAILEGKIRVTKLNLENNQSWADGMKLLLNAKMLGELSMGPNVTRTDRLIDTK